MPNTKTLTEDELKKAIGGILTKEAKDWITKHKDEVNARSYAAGYNSWIDLLYVVLANQAEVYDVAKLKETISKQFDVSDLY